MMFIDSSISPIEGPLRGRGIRPLDLNTVRIIHTTDLREAQKIKHGQDDASYRPARNAERLLTPGLDYAELPGYDGQTPISLLQSLPHGANILDVGCADGSFGNEIANKINPGVHIYGFDARTVSGQEVNLDGAAIGTVYDLNPKHFPQTEFDLVLSSALVYHLGDPLLGIVKMADMVRRDGLLLLSTVPRIINSSSNEWVEKESSIIPSGNVDYRYYGGRNIYDLQGKLIPSKEFVKILGKKLGFNMEYAAATAQNSGAMTYGGQISGKKSTVPDNSIHLYYCQTDGDQLPRIWKDTLGYVVAKTEEEALSLQRSGFVEMK